MTAPTKNGFALNQRSRTLLEGPNRAGARAMFKAIGLTDEDLEKPIIGIANTWTEIGPCNFGLRMLAQEVRKGISAGTYKSPHLKLSSLSRETKTAFELSGFDMFIETHTDMKAAVDSF